MPLYGVLSLFRDHPWLKSYWYIGLAVLMLVGLMMIVYDGHREIQRGQQRRQPKLKEERAATQNTEQQLLERESTLNRRNR